MFGGCAAPTEIDYPERNYDQFTYDARCNVIQTTRGSKPGSGLASIVTTSGFDSACANPVTCNKPNWTKDAKGNETDYTYGPIHGGVLTVTRPAGPNGVRPQTRYSYGQIPTYAKNGSGALVQAGAIWSLTGISTCATASAPTCIGTADEIKTTISYAGSYNALPTQITKGSGLLCRPRP